MLHMWSILLSSKSVPHIAEHIVEHIMLHCAHDLLFPAKKEKKRKFGKFCQFVFQAWNNKMCTHGVLKLL